MTGSCCAPGRRNIMKEYKPEGGEYLELKISSGTSPAELLKIYLRRLKPAVTKSYCMDFFTR